MSERRQKFVLVTAWSEIWCTPYNIYGEGVETVEPHRAVYRLVDRLLESPLLVAWFGKNICSPHPKLHPLPLGPKKKPSGMLVRERMIKKDVWLSLGANHPQRLFLHTSKPQLVAHPLFEIATTGSPAYLPHRDLRPLLMKVS
jgi:hypothetical protein